MDWENHSFATLLYLPRKSADSLLAHPLRGSMYLFDGRALFNGFVEIAAADLKHRHAMPKHTFISSEWFCMVSNATVNDSPVDLLHWFNPLWSIEQVDTM